MKTRAKIFIGAMIIIIALIAFGIYSSYEVSRTFVEINKELEEQNRNEGYTNEELYRKIDQSHVKDHIIEVQAKFQNFNEKLETYKTAMAKSLDYETMQVADEEIDDFFFSGDALSLAGEDFRNDMHSFDIFLSTFPTIQNDTILSKKIDDFYTERVELNNRKSVSWLEYHFKGFPRISSLTRISSIQADAIQIERRYLLGILNLE